MANILFVSAEVAPFSKAGGLADVAGSLPPTVVSQDIQCTVISPLYDQVDRKKYEIRSLGIKGSVEHCSRPCAFEIHEATSLSTDDLKFWFVDHPEFFMREGIYTDSTGEGYADNNERYFFFQLVILELISKGHISPDVLHCNDHHTGLLPVLLRTYKYPIKSVFTIHNFLYHGHFSAAELDQLPARIHSHVTPTQWNNYSALLEAIAHADAVTTVSQGYANELMAGENVDPHSIDVINNRPDRIQGILNGIDTEYWSPESDTYLKAHYSTSDLNGKAKNKGDLMQKVGLRVDLDAPLIGSVSRLVENKGYDLIFSSLNHFLQQGAYYVFLGSGDPIIAEKLKTYSEKYPEQFAFVEGFSEALAHQIEAGSDMFIMPSRFEPCGLNQLYSLRYGTIPIVHRTGGLGDSVEQWSPGAGTGFLFEPYDSDALKETLDLALDVYANQTEWGNLIKRAMRKDFSWSASAKHYIKLYTSWK